MLVTAAPGPAAGKAWHFCCTVKSVLKNDEAEPEGSGCPAAAPYSSALRNMLQPRLGCRPPTLPSANLQRDNKQQCVIDDTLRGRSVFMGLCSRYLLALGRLA